MTRAVRVGRAASVGLVAALVSGCVTSDVTLIGPRPPVRPPGCQVEIFPSTRPPYPITQFATARANCIGSRTDCIEELRKQACGWGADTIFGFEEGMNFVTATFAVRAAGAPAQAAAAVPADGACTPICSPGFACEGGRCIPQCNPPCESSETCNRKRTCEAAGAPSK